VYWQVGSSATIGIGSIFRGKILALASITLNGGTLYGKALASTGAVTMSARETVDGPPCGNN
jgi:type VI secretion system secreted protein VgrG